MKKEIDIFGTIHYYNDNNELHREDGPALESTSGDKSWWINGKPHREDGPAIEWVDGSKEYWYNNIYYPEIETDEEWIKFVKLMVFL